MKPLSAFTLAEVVAFTQLSADIFDHIDRQLGNAMIAAMLGEEGAMSRCYDRLNCLGEFELADKVREIIQEQ